jgi:hypothetical protein
MQFDNKNEGTKQSLFVFRIDSPMLLPSASATLVLARGEGVKLTVLLGLFKFSELGEQKPGNSANLPSDPGKAVGGLSANFHGVSGREGNNSEWENGNRCNCTCCQGEKEYFPY